MLRDDEKTAATNGSSLSGHNSADTSLYLDDADDMTGMCRYTNTVDWTIPIKAVSLSGRPNENTLDQVFFGMWFYQYEAAVGRFSVYSKGLPFAHVDNNNFSIMQMGVGLFTSENVDSKFCKDKKQELFMLVYRDRDSKNGSDPAFEIYIYHQEDDVSSLCRYENILATSAFDDKMFYVHCCIINADNDTTLIRELAHYFVYTEPIVKQL